MLISETEKAEAARPAGVYGKDWGNPKGEECVLCHRKHTPGLYQEWNKSMHGQRGVNCLDCHKADGKDKDGFRHKGQLISVIVTPKDCARCHTTEFEEKRMNSGAFLMLGTNLCLECRSPRCNSSGGVTKVV